MPDFPVIDISRFKGADKVSVAAAVDAACRETGFLAIEGHGVAQAIIADAWNATRAFFDQPDEVKALVTMPYAGYPHGYSPFAAEALAKSLGGESAPDLKESFSIGPIVDPGTDPDHPYAHIAETPNLWPELAGFRGAWESYFKALEAVSSTLMRIFAVALGMDEGYFEPFIDWQAGAMRALNYPDQPNPPLPGQLRAGAHSDYGSVTILLPEDKPGGLQILWPDGEWRDVPVIDGAFVVNIGDLMAVWTNDRWVSTMHRVVNPPPSSDGSTRRQSIAFFHLPNWHALIETIPTCLEPGETPRYEPIEAGEHLMAKFRAAMGADQP